MSELIMLWVIPVLLWVLVWVQIDDYKKRKAVSADLKSITEQLQKLQALIKGEQK
jgi:cytochrome c-type biogenesis protein CcmH/NrfF